MEQTSGQKLLALFEEHVDPATYTPWHESCLVDQTWLKMNKTRNFGGFWGWERCVYLCEKTGVNVNLIYDGIYIGVTNLVDADGDIDQTYDGAMALARSVLSA